MAHRQAALASWETDAPSTRLSRDCPPFRSGASRQQPGPAPAGVSAGEWNRQPRWRSQRRNACEKIYWIRSRLLLHKNFFMDIVYTTRMLLIAQFIGGFAAELQSKKPTIYCAPDRIFMKLQVGISGIVLLYICVFVLRLPSAAQTSAIDSAKQAITLGQKGKCREALPILKKSTSQISDKQLEYQTAMMTARCAMSLDQTETAVRALLLLNRDFPRDPEVLYTTTHFYSELASRASQELAATAPNSQQAQQLEAEGFESQGNWEKAQAQYQQILEQNPQAPGIHYR